MKILVACRAIEDEIKAALIRLDLNYEVVWIEGGLHDTPNRLRERLQEVMYEAEGRCDTLIFALGYCGGGMSDLNTGDYNTVIFLADDCLSVLLGSLKARIHHNRPATFFLTAGWMKHENNIVDSYHRNVEKYGQAKADRINKMMLDSYGRFAMVDTGCYDLAEVAAKVAPLAEKLDLPVESLPGDSSWLEALLTGPWADPTRFLVIPPKSNITFDDWMALLNEAAAGNPSELP